MKKIIVSILMVLLIVGCSCKKTEQPIKVKLDYKEMPTAQDSSTYFYNRDGLLSYDLKSTSEYDEKITNKDSFLLFVYSETCSGCKLLSPAIKPYIDEHQVVIYTLDYSNVSDKHDLYKAGINTTPFLVLIEEGKIVYLELMTLSFNNPTQNVETMNKWMGTHVEWGNN